VIKISTISPGQLDLFDGATQPCNCVKSPSSIRTEAGDGQKYQIAAG